MKYDSNKLFCFSPPVMIATFVIEISLAIYTVWRYKLTKVSRLAIILFVSLSVFQLAEYMVCRGIGGNALVWSRIGYIAITVLHMLAILTKTKKKWMIWPGYLAGAAFIAFFSLIGRSIDGHRCLGNYVIFQVAPGFGWLYGLYYYGLLVVSLLIGLYYLRRSLSKKMSIAIRSLMLGYTIFIIPATTVNLVDPTTIAGIPSIMCGFAVLLAIILAFLVLPAAGEKKT